MTKFFSRKHKAEAQTFFEEAYPFPVAAAAVAVLLAANVALTVVAVSALG